MYIVTDGRTDKQTDDSMMPIATKDFLKSHARLVPTAKGVGPIQTGKMLHLLAGRSRPIYYDLDPSLSRRRLKFSPAGVCAL